MTRREAAQVLGIRESADAKRIKTAHRKILIANHPDKGGSPYMAAKVFIISWQHFFTLMQPSCSSLRHMVILTL